MPAPRARQHQGRMKVNNAADMDRLADEVAQGKTLDLAATRLSLTPARTEYLWKRICTKLGRQAQ